VTPERVRAILAEADRLGAGPVVCPCEGCVARRQLQRLVAELAGAVSEAQAGSAFLAGQLEYERVVFAQAVERLQEQLEAAGVPAGAVPDVPADGRCLRCVTEGPVPGCEYCRAEERSCPCGAAMCLHVAMPALGILNLPETAEAPASNERRSLRDVLADEQTVGDPGD
jgi:hypothetical protein